MEILNLFIYLLVFLHSILLYYFFIKLNYFYNDLETMRRITKRIIDAHESNAQTADELMIDKYVEASKQYNKNLKIMQEAFEALTMQCSSDLGNITCELETLKNKCSKSNVKYTKN